MSLRWWSTPSERHERLQTRPHRRGTGYVMVSGDGRQLVAPDWICHPIRKMTGRA
jgi:hypothetical protein